jgi:hypothetical protein
LKFDYLIRFRGNIAVTSAEGETRPAADWVGVGGRPRTLRNAFVTADGYQVGTVVCVHANTSKQRTHSLFRQGAMLYELIPTMPEPRLRPLVERFGAMLLEIPVFAGVYCTV